MHRSAAELALDALDKHQTIDRNCFRPAIVTHCATTLKRLLDPLAMCSLKIPHVRKPATRSKSVGRLWRNAWEASESRDNRFAPSRWLTAPARTMLRSM